MFVSRSLRKPFRQKISSVMGEWYLGVLPKIHPTFQVCQDCNFDEVIFPFGAFITSAKGCFISLLPTLFHIVATGWQMCSLFINHQKSAMLGDCFSIVHRPVLLIISIVNPAPHNMAMKVAKTFPFPQTQTQQKKKAPLTCHCSQELCVKCQIFYQILKPAFTPIRNA